MCRQTNSKLSSFCMYSHRSNMNDNADLSERIEFDFDTNVNFWILNITLRSVAKSATIDNRYHLRSIVVIF